MNNTIYILQTNTIQKKKIMFFQNPNQIMENLVPDTPVAVERQFVCDHCFETILIVAEIKLFQKFKRNDLMRSTGIFSELTSFLI